MSTVRVTSRERGDRDSDRGSPAPRIRVGYIQENQPMKPPNQSELLTEVLLLPPESHVDPALFMSLGCLELYDHDFRYCIQSLREERIRLLERRQALEIELMKQETAEIRVFAEEKRLQHLELATETTGLAPETLAPMSVPRVKLLDDLGTILSKIRTLLESVHIIQQKQQLAQNSGCSSSSSSINSSNGQDTEQPQQQQQSHHQFVVNMALFQKHGLMDLYDPNPTQCIGLLRVEHARLATRRDDLELEYERQRTALLKTLQ
ncbi:hypothetical protein BGZ76_001589 [Entomortierella beljakovae]|nr:hypothetical protein BGZ76_001589 [Entomortierella beljakovae]